MFHHFQRNRFGRTALAWLLAAIPLVILNSAPCRADFLGQGSTTIVSRTPHPAVVRIISLEKGGTSYGSGTLIAREGKLGIIVSNWHVVRDADGEILVSFPGGFRSSARVIRSDRTWDLAALLTWVPDGVEPVPFASALPRPGEPLAIAGYGTGAFRAVAGTCQQYVAPGLNMPSDMVQLSAVARQGDSGGPILNQKGELAGVLFGAGWRTTSGSHVKRVKSFLQPVLERLQQEPNQLAEQRQLAPEYGNQLQKPELPQAAGPRQDPLPASRTSQLEKIDTAASNEADPRAVPEEDAGVGQVASDDSQESNGSDTALDWEAATLLTSAAAQENPANPRGERQAGEVMPPGVENGSQEVSLQAEEKTLHWKDLFGHSWPEQLKSLLALVGAIAIVVQLARR